jgi:hypothetical protein
VRLGAFWWASSNPRSSGLTDKEKVFGGNAVLIAVFRRLPEKFR